MGKGTLLSYSVVSDRIQLCSDLHTAFVMAGAPCGKGVALTSQARWLSLARGNSPLKGAVVSNRRPQLRAAGGWACRPGLGDLGGAPLSLLPSGLATENNSSNYHILLCEALKGNGLHVGRRIISSIAIDIKCYERTLINNASFSWLRV